MIYIVIDMIGIILAGLVSQYIKRFISQKQLRHILLIVNLCILIVGIQGAIETKNTMLMLASCIIGAFIGVKLDLDERFQKLGSLFQSIQWLKNHFSVEGFITVFMIQCVGSMAIVGPLNIGLQNDANIMFIKIILDIISSLIYGVVYGPSVALSGVFVFIYESLIFLCAGFLQPILAPDVIHEIGAIGSLLIVGMSLDLLGIIEMRIANYLLALLGPIIYYLVILFI